MERDTNSKINRWRPRLAWAAIAAFVVAYDALCPKGETLSEEVYRQRETKLGRFLIDRLMDDVVDHLRGEHNWINDVGALSPKRESYIEKSI